MIEELQKALIEADSAIQKNLEEVTAKLHQEVDKYVKANREQFKGDQGVVGEIGPKGADGRDGTDGKDGKNGKDGRDGKDGAMGIPGLNGRDGRNGIDGKNGRDGTVPDVDKIVKKYVDKIKVEHGIDGVGVKDIKTEDDKFVFKMTDGTVKKIELPKSNVNNYASQAAMLDNRRTFVTGGLYASKEVDVRAPENGQMLVYHDGKWVNEYVSSGGDAVDINEVSEVTISQATDYILLYRGGGDPFVSTTGTFNVRINMTTPMQAESIIVETGVSGLTTEESDKLMATATKSDVYNAALM